MSVTEVEVKGRLAYKGLLDQHQAAMIGMMRALRSAATCVMITGAALGFSAAAQAAVIPQPSTASPHLTSGAQYAFKSNAAGDGNLYYNGRIASTSGRYASKLEASGEVTWQRLLNFGNQECLAYYKSGPLGSDRVIEVGHSKCGGSAEGWNVLWHPALGIYTIENEMTKTLLTANGDGKDVSLTKPIAGSGRYRQQWRVSG